MGPQGLKAGFQSALCRERGRCRLELSKVAVAGVSALVVGIFVELPKLLEMSMGMLVLVVHSSEQHDTSASDMYSWVEVSSIVLGSKHNSLASSSGLRTYDGGYGILEIPKRALVCR